MAIPHQELHLRDLSLSEAQNMVESLLKTDAIPKDLQQFIRNKVEGNPFYLEEAINSLIESNILVSENGDWRVIGPITDTEISATIHAIPYPQRGRHRNDRPPAKPAGDSCR